MKYKTVKLTTVFEPKRGNAQYTKAYGVSHKGEYPVYSAAATPLTYINSYDYDGTYLTWNTNGFGGYISVLSGKFSINGDRGILIPLRDDINLYYVAQSLQGDLRALAKGRLGDRGKNEFTKVSLDTIKNKAEVTFPVNEDDSSKFNLNDQAEIAEKLKRINDLKSYIISQTNELESSKFNIEPNGRFKNITVGEIFDLDQSTNSSTFTKKFVNQHPGEIPVYSASADEDLVGYGYVADNLAGVKYFNDVLTWNIDGSVGRAVYRQGRFSLSEKVIPLILRDEWKGKIDLTYLRYEIEERAAERGFGYSNKAGKSRIADIEIPIPIDDKDSVDIARQVLIADQYAKAYELKSSVISQLREVTSMELSLR